ncbi:hypothetical protein LUZ61_021322 [Rhynchospora tenuis]|uniref:SWIM-type domain-containing protein n=1 Tax=Rhynchospora tenuis TaxID=198213 RepID=A0AAD5Z292_9POAL|nr:hypothetical protein LUZ61_021322 [Rhynchospora tenuis]
MGPDLNATPSNDPEDYIDPIYHTSKPVVESDDPEDDPDYVDPREDDPEDGPETYSDLSTGEEYSDVEDLYDEDDEVPFHSNTDDAPNAYITGRTAMHHPVSALCDISDFQYVGMGESKTEHEGELAPGRIFRSKKQLILAVCDYSCKRNVEMRTQSSNKSRIIMVCVQKPNCPWRLYAICEGFNANWKISTNPHDHICTRPYNERRHDNLTAELIAEHVREELRKDLGLKISQVGGLIRARYTRIEPTYNKAWRGRERALEQLFGSWEGAYNKLPRLLEAIKRTTPGTKYDIISWETNDPNVRVFKMAAWAFGPCIEALKHARPVISIDASFLSGRYKGKLFTVCAYDPENHLIPVAFGLAEKEDKNSWGWFMSWVRFEVIGDMNRKYCVVSDRHKAIKAVFASTEYGWKAQGPQKVAIHRYCMQHVAENLFKKVGGGKQNKGLKDFFKVKLANKKNEDRFRERWEQLKAANRIAYEYLRNCGKHDETDRKERPKLFMWAQAFDKGHRWGLMTSNGSESLNSIFRVERRLPVTAIVEGTFYKCANWMNKRTQLVLERHRLVEIWPKRIEDKLKKHSDKADSMSTTTFRLDLGTFIVKARGEYRDGHGFEVSKYRVEIPPEMVQTDPQLPFTHTKCSCQKPQLTGIPCAHVIAVCKQSNYNVDQFVDERYSLYHQEAIWSGGQFHCYRDEDQWPVYDGPTIIPDKSIINRGRRKIIRTEMAMDKMEGKNKDKSKGPKPKKPSKKKGQPSTSEASTSHVRQREPPYPMDAMQFGRYSSRPPSRTNSRRSQAQPNVQAAVQPTIQPARRSLHVDGPNNNVQPRRNSISTDPRSVNAPSNTMRFESARFTTCQTSGASTSGKKKGAGLSSKIRNIFGRK